MQEPPKIGPTGTYEQGKANDRDKGGLNAALTVNKGTRQLMLDFATTLTWISAPPEDTKMIIKLLRDRIREAFGELSYNVEELPIRVVVDRKHGLIESHFPTSVSVLVANPELYLAWAQRLEEAVAQLTGNAREV